MDGKLRLNKRATEWCFNNMDYGCIFGVPSDAAPSSATYSNSIAPVRDTQNELDWQRKERIERELIERNKRDREEIRRILGQ